MSSIAIIFNGIHFYASVAEKAFSRAKLSGEEVLSIFALARHEQEEGYVFPSDLDAAQSLSTGADADRDDRKIIDSHIRLLEREAKVATVELRTRIMENPSAADLDFALEGCEIIFMQADNSKYPDPIPAGVDLNKLLKDNTIPVEFVS